MTDAKTAGSLFGRLYRSIRTKGIRCTFWFHRDWYEDHAVFMYVRRCGNCGFPETPGLLRLVESERAIWAEVPQTLPFEEQKTWVWNRFFLINGTL